MKRKMILLLVVLVFGMNSVNALTINPDNTYTNEKGVIITEEQYKELSSHYRDDTIDLLNKNNVKVLTDTNAKKKSEETYSITTDIIKNGKVIDSITIPATEKQAKDVAKYKTLHVMKDGKIYNTSKSSNIPDLEYSNLYDTGYDVTYETSSKKIYFTYAEYNYGQTPTIILEVQWFSIPLIKKYDILAARWNTSRPTSNLVSYEGYQKCKDSNGRQLRSNYDLNGSNYKITTNGFGQIMNIYDSAYSDLYLGIMVEFSNSLGNTVYGTYQHAGNSNITLNQAKSYTFSSSGLGNVVYFSNSTVRGYYDGMQGVSSSLS